MKVVLYKIGGSLFKRPDLFVALEAYLKQSATTEQALLLFGGGEMVAQVRAYSDQFQLDEEVAHQLAIKAMTLNAKLANSQLKGSTLLRSEESLQESITSKLQFPILDVGELLTETEGRSTFILPHTWDSTSDTIAAWLTRYFEFDELRLLKSTFAPTFDELRHNCTDKVDKNFSEHLPDLKSLSWINFMEWSIAKPQELHYLK